MEDRPTSITLQLNRGYFYPRHGLSTDPNACKGAVVPVLEPANSSLGARREDCEASSSSIIPEVCRVHNNVNEIDHKRIFKM